MSEISQRIHKIRKASNLSQKIFAERLGINQGHISKIERGIATPSSQLIRSICREFKIREQWLVKGQSVLSKVEGLTDEDIERFELDLEGPTKKGLHKFLLGACETVYILMDEVAEYQFVADELGEPDDELVRIKEELESGLDYLRSELMQLFYNMSKKQKPPWIKKLEKVQKGLTRKKVVLDKKP